MAARARRVLRWLRRVGYVVLLVGGLFVQADWSASAVAGGTVGTPRTIGSTAEKVNVSLVNPLADDPEPTPEPSTTESPTAPEGTDMVVGLTEDRWDALLVAAGLIVFLLAIHVVASWGRGSRG